MGQEKDSKLRELAELEKAQSKNAEIDKTLNSEFHDEKIKKLSSSSNLKEEKMIEDEENSIQPSIIDGYKLIPNNELPHNGRLYPASWSFAYRCPTSEEIANFSSVNENDQLSIINAIQELIRKCVVIVDTDSQKQISSLEINDGDRVYFLLKLREFYLPNDPISYNTMCLSCKEQITVNLNSASLQFYHISEKIFNSFDGRTFNLDMGLTSGPIVFRIPTFNTSQRIFRYITNTYKNKENTKESEVFNKKFLLVAPFLYENGNESVEALKNKFRQISRDGERLKAYVDLANNLRFDNKETFVYTHDCGSEEVAEIRFPGGWKKMFVGSSTYNGLFE